MAVQPSGKRAIQALAEDTPPVSLQGGKPSLSALYFFCPGSCLDQEGGKAFLITEKCTFPSTGQVAASKTALAMGKEETV